MRISIPRETWPCEARVAATPSAVHLLILEGHSVIVEQNAGSASGFADDAYIIAGAEIAPTPEETFDRGEWIWKVLRPTAHESRLLRAGQALFACLHVGEPLPEGVRAIAAERAQLGTESPPVLAAMSEIAGRLAVGIASHVLQRQHGGRGLFLGGVTGVESARVVVIGAGNAGRAAVRMAAAMGAEVVALDTDIGRLRALGEHVRVGTLYATAHNVERALATADVVIAATRATDADHDALSAMGPRAPRVATRAHLALMQPGAVIVDLSITDGGAFESTPVTSLDSPSRLLDGVVHVGVPNLPGGVPRTASIALSQAALPILRALLRTAPK